MIFLIIEFIEFLGRRKNTLELAYKIGNLIYLMCAYCYACELCELYEIFVVELKCDED